MGQMMMDVDSYPPKPHKSLTRCVLDESESPLVLYQKRQNFLAS